MIKLTTKLTVFLVPLVSFLCGCGTGRGLSNVNSSTPNKPTVTFKTNNTNQLNEAEDSIASCFLDSGNRFIPKYIAVNYDSVNNRFDSLYSSLNHMNKIKFIFSRKRQYRFYSDAAGTDYLLVMEIHCSYDTTRTSHTSTRLWDHLWKNSGDLTKELVGANETRYVEETYQVRKIKYKLKYIDGSSGKTLWSTRCRWNKLFRSKKKNPVLLIKNKFKKRFPYKLIDGIYQK